MISEDNLEDYIKETANNVLKTLNKPALIKDLQQSMPIVFKEAIMKAMGFEKDSFSNGWKIKSTFGKRSLAIHKLIEQRASDIATNIIDSIDLEQISLTKTDKKTIIDAYKRGRRCELEEAAYILGKNHVTNTIQSTLNEVLKDITNSVNQSDKKSVEDLLNLVFGSSKKEANKNWKRVENLSEIEDE